MKTTVDLPQEVLRKAKITAVERNTTLKDLICKSLIREIESPANTQADAGDERKRRSGALLRSMDRIRIESPIGRFDRAEAERQTSLT